VTTYNLHKVNCSNSDQSSSRKHTSHSKPK